MPADDYDGWADKGWQRNANAPPGTWKPGGPVFYLCDTDVAKRLMLDTNAVCMGECKQRPESAAAAESWYIDNMGQICPDCIGVDEE